MKWNIGSTSVGPAILATPQPDMPAGHPAVGGRGGDAKCPIDHAALPRRAAPPPPPAAGAPAKCPVDHSKLPAPAAPASSSRSAAGPAKCPVDHAALKAPGAGPAAAAAAVAAAGSSALNPLNNMPTLSTSRAPGQMLDLPLERTSSTIPRPRVADEPESGGVWEYPSPQQFYNALVRKGWETPEDSIEMVVDIHNFINEMAWEEVMKWERRMPGGEHAMLARFQGRPGELSPKARFHLWAGSLFPSKFKLGLDRYPFRSPDTSTEPPFDRHDWVVTRPIVDPAAPPQESPYEKAAGEPVPEVATRYVIDYYSAPPDEDGNPVFSLDVRPALDSWAALAMRVRVAAEDWTKGDQE